MKKGYSLLMDTDIFSYKNINLPNSGIKIYDFDKRDFKKIENANLIVQHGSLYILEKNENNERKIYIGESDNVIKRIKQHINNEGKDFNHIYILSHDNYNTDIRKKIEEYVIKKFSESILKFNVTNKITSSLNHLNSWDSIFLDDILNNLDEALWILKFNLLKEDIKNVDVNLTKNNVIENSTIKDELFYFTNWNEVIATLKIDENNEYWLLKGSKISKEWLITKRPSSIYEKRKSEIKIDENNILLEDIKNKKPSPLSNLVYGRYTNGYEVFKNADGVSLNAYLKRK